MFFYDRISEILYGGAPVSTVMVRGAGCRWSARLLIRAKLLTANNDSYNYALAA